MGGGMGGGGIRGGIPAPGGPGGAFAQPGTLVGVDANWNGMISGNEMGFIPGGGGMGGGGGGSGGNDISDAEADAYIRTVTTYKTVSVPVTRNKYKVVNYTVPQTVPYTDYQT